ncbi:MAG: metallophosphoesterase [Leptothrix sp. (in: b-proteobacteria)]
MATQDLLTLIHVSDLHIGPIDPGGSGDSAAHPAIGKMLMLMPFLDGLIGHHGESLRNLESFIRGLPRQRGVPRRLLVSGDFTRSGGLHELALADDYLHSTVNIGTSAAPVLTGLQVPRPSPPAVPAMVLDIPGNHDHWGGTNGPISGAPSVYMGAKFANSGPLRTVVPLPNGRELVIARVDSDADVYPMGMARGLAWGAFRSQLPLLARQLGASNPNEIRVLAIHHSYSHCGKTLRMQRSSRDALLKFLRAHDIQVVLTGHTHVCDHFEIRDNHGNLVAHELCCGSTTQLDHVPHAWRPWLRTPAKSRRTPNSLFMHRLETDNSGRLWWHARPHYRDPVAGFVDAGLQMNVLLR